MKKLCLLLAGLWIMTGVAQETKEPGINEFVFVEVEPQPVNLQEVIQKIGYPEEAVRENIEGNVVVRILVDEQGNYVKHAIVNQAPPALVNAVEAHISEISFTPALQNGKAIKYWKNLRFPFKLLEEKRDPREVAIEVLTEVLQKDSTDYQALLKRGIQYRDLNRLDEAIADFEASIAFNPLSSQPVELPPPAEPKKKKKKKKKGKEEQESQQSATPGDSLALPYMFYAYYAKGTARALKQDYQGAVEDMTKSLEYTAKIPQPDSQLAATIPTVYMERGFAYSAMEQYDKALADYDWVIAHAPAELACNVHQLKADIYLTQKDYPNLVKAYDDIIACKPSPLVYYSRGYYKTLSGDYAGAIDDFNTMLQESKIVNLNIAAQNRIGWAYWKLGKYDEALAAIQKALDINVLNAQSYFYQALVFHSQGKTDEACQLAKKAMSFGMEGTPEEADLQAFIKEINCTLDE